MRRKFEVKTPKLIVWQGYVVMSDSERPFFEKLFERIADMKVSRVLEVGFGLGISARLIQDTFRPQCHDIVEMDPTIYEDLQAFCSANNGVNPIRGDFWNFTPRQRYDFIFYDLFEYYDVYLDEWTDRVSELLIPGGVVCVPIFDLDSPSETTIAGFKRLRRDVLRVPPYLLADGRRARTGIFECWQRKRTALRRSSRTQKAFTS
jgi:trans-aconitate methyltransferase